MDIKTTEKMPTLTPMGSPPTQDNLEKLSAHSMIEEPMIAENSILVRPMPTMSRIRLGTMSPINPIMPQVATVLPTIKAIHTVEIKMTLDVLTPNSLASAWPNRRACISGPNLIRIIKGTHTLIPTMYTIDQFIFSKLPKVQNT